MPEGPGSVLRLRVELPGGTRWVLLDSGEHLIGAEPSCTVVAPVKGVARRHASLRVFTGGLELTDLGSAQGTFVNGAPITSAKIEAGQELCFGPVRALVECIDRDDAILGLELIGTGHDGTGHDGTGHDDTGSATTAVMTDQGRSTVSELVAGADGAATHLAEAVFTRLSLRPEPDLSGALSLLLRQYQLRAAAVVEWPRQGEPVVVAAVGEARAIPPRAAVLSSVVSWHPGQVQVLPTDEPDRSAGVCLCSPAQELLGLLVWDMPASERTKPELGLVLRFIERLQPRRLVSLPQETAPSSVGLHLGAGIVAGESPAMVSLYQQMQLVLQCDSPVLLTGETGVGKEHLARALHDSSHRATRQLVAISCAAVPNDLLEAELFGTGSGGVSGVRAHPGRLYEADGGTLFFDEISVIPADLQARLVRVVQTGEVLTPGLPPLVVNVRIIAATNVDLRQRLNEGRFCRDLYELLAGLVLEVPPLRKRREDLPQLLGHFLGLISRQTCKQVAGITVKALRALVAYAWPGNVRELEQVVQQLVERCTHGQAIDSRMLPAQILSPGPAAAATDLDLGGGLKAQLERLERRLIRQALLEAGGNVTRAAQLLEISRNGLNNRLVRLAIRLDELLQPD